MKFLGALQRFTDNVPLWAYNLLTLVSGGLTLISFACGVYVFYFGEKPLKEHIPTLAYIIGIMVIITAVILIGRLFKFRKLANSRVKNFSHMHTLTHVCRDTFFDIQHQYKLGQLTKEFLREKVQTCLTEGLDSLCAVLKDVTGCEVSACIKLIEACDGTEKINLDNARITVFCRSKNTHPDRKNYDKEREEQSMLLKNDTALMQVVGPQRKEDRFYCQNLDKYIEAFEKVNPEYQCPTKNRRKYYRGMMILPIRIAAELLFFRRGYNVNSQDIIGFLCVDSLSTNAFRPEQKDYNCDIGNAFADQFYIILNELRSYLSELKRAETESPAAPPPHID